MPFVRPGEEPPKRNPEDRPVTDPAIVARWYRMDLEQWAREDAEKARVVAEAERIVLKKDK